MKNKLLYLILLIIIPVTVYVRSTDGQTKIRLAYLEHQESNLMEQQQKNKKVVEQSIIDLTESANRLASSITKLNTIDNSLKSTQLEIDNIVKGKTIMKALLETKN